MAKSRTSRKKPADSGRSKQPAGDQLHPAVHRMRRTVAAGRMAAVPPASAGSTVVPRANVGAAVQAAVSFENASQVVAQATDDTRQMFQVSWG